uniref:B-ZIP transcription factor n=1 Tax=Ganoderma boninense TaxID=34458 RepID=A0A5K1JSZ1_9APHY|nr:B-ZIP transcription factor [Ganoderma boninense]
MSSADSDAHSSFSPIPSSARDTQLFSQNFGLNGIFELATSGKTSLFEPGGTLDTFDCGFCSENTPCVCRELALQQVAERMAVSSMKMENTDQNAPPVPLRRRAPNPSLQPIFPITLPAPEPTNPEIPSCTGDPSNCPACADDAFGKAFCAAITPSTSAMAPTAAQLTSSLLMSEAFSTSETIPCDAAWRQIKNHPNAAFTDLSLLAEVVARRSKCTGPRVEISPAPGSITPERGASPNLGLGLPATFAQPFDSQSIILTDPHAQYHERQRTRGSGTSSPPQLVPQDVLVKCGRQRVREVMADGVRDALRLLDARFAQP